MKLSIILPIYKRANEIKSFLREISKQNSKDFEVVIVLDTNRENSLNEILPWVKKMGDRINLIFNTKRRGYSNAVSTAIKSAKGEYILSISTSDKIQSNTGISTIISEIKNANNPDILEFPLQIRGGLKWNAIQRISVPKSKSIKSKPECIAKTMPVIFNKVFKKEVVTRALVVKPYKEMNTRFIFEVLYAKLICHDEITFATSNQKVVQTYISKQSSKFSPTTLSRLWKSVFALSGVNDQKYFSELLYASLFHQVVIMSKIVYSYKIDIMIQKNWKNIQNFYKKYEKEINSNPYILIKNKESILLQELKNPSELKKVLKEF